MRILVQRYSALGDIALLLPVLAALKRDNPQLEIHLVSRPFIKSLIGDLDIKFHAADLKKANKGFLGLWRLARQLKKDIKPDLVFDVHNVLRSRILNGFFLLMGIKVFRLDKERQARKALVRKDNKVALPLKHSSDKYAETFKKAGLKFHFQTDEASLYPLKERVNSPISLNPKATFHLGIAPMAKHKAKRYPLPQMQKVLKNYADQQNYHFYFFGGADEKEELENLAKAAGVQHTIVAGALKFPQEIALMRNLNLLIAMDSSNMHLAALANCKIISIWGATHPLAGFTPLGKHENLMVQIPRDELDCRPCSIFGNKACFRGDYACLTNLAPAKIIAKIDEALKPITK
jgi:ADP-heptose:LPS heptosyltransferase